MSIREIFCQDKAIGVLQRALGADRMAHSYIFAGPNGVGRFKTAREWAKLLLCKSRVQEKNKKSVFFDSCGVCRSCTAFETGSHPDFQHIYKELIRFTEGGKGKTPVDLPIDVIRDFLIKKVSVRPMLSSNKVYVVSESEKLNAASQNALLKVLEEPPGYCFIIMLCTRLEKLLPTTRSRCQIVRFAAIDKARIVAKLKDDGAGEKEALYWAEFSEGSLGIAMKWAGLKLGSQRVYVFKRQLLDRLAKYEFCDAVELAEWICQRNKQIAAALAEEEKGTSKKDISRLVQKGVLRMIALAGSDVMKLNAGVKDGFANSDQTEQIEALVKKTGLQHAAAQVVNTYESMRWVDSNVNERLIFEQLLLNCVSCDKMPKSAVSPKQSV